MLSCITVYYSHHDEKKKYTKLLFLCVFRQDFNILQIQMLLIFLLISLSYLSSCMQYGIDEGS